VSPAADIEIGFEDVAIVEVEGVAEEVRVGGDDQAQAGDRRQGVLDALAAPAVRCGVHVVVSRAGRA